MITEENLINLRFSKVKEHGENYYYYEREFGLHYSSLTLISEANDEIEGDDWRIYFYQVQGIEIDNMTDLVNLIDILERNSK